MRLSVTYDIKDILGHCQTIFAEKTVSVREDFEKINEPTSKYKQEWVNSQLKKIAEKFDNFYQCEYAKLEFELKRRSKSSDAIIEKCKDREQKLEK